MTPLEHQQHEPESVETGDHSVDYAKQRAEVAALLSRRGFLGVGALVTGTAISALLMSDEPLAAEDKHMLEQALEQEKDKLWKAQDVEYNQYGKLKDKMAKDVFTAEELVEMFRGGDIHITCIDERITVPEGDKIAIAGSSVLLTEKAVEEFAARLIKSGRKIGSVSWHDKCGACAKAAELLKAVLEKIDPEMQQHPKVPKPEEIAVTTATKLCKKLGKPPVIHIGFDKEHAHMEGSEDFHHARRVLIDTVGTADAGHNAFEVTAAYYPSVSDVVSDVDLSIKIAMGEHGMGEKRFNKKLGGKPFQVVLVQDPRNGAYVTEIKKALDPILKANPDTVELLLLTPPKEILPAVGNEAKKENGALDPNAPMPQSSNLQYDGVHIVRNVMTAEELAA